MMNFYKNKGYFLKDSLWSHHEIYDTVEEAIEAGTQQLAFSQRSMYIAQLEEDGTKTDVMVARWHGVQPSEDDEVLVQYGKFGFYSPFKFINEDFVLLEEEELI